LWPVFASVAPVFSVVDATLLRPLPYADTERLMAVHGTSSTAARDFISYPNFLDWRARTQTFEALAAWHLDMFTLDGEPSAERVIGGRVSHSYFSTLGVAPLLGLTFDAREDQPGGAPVVLLGEGVQRAFLVAQLALTVTLMSGTGLLTRSLVGLWGVDPGFDARGVVTFMSGLPRERAGDPERVRSAIEQVAERLAAVPHAHAVSGVFGALPYTGNNNAVDYWRADAPTPTGSEAPLALFSAVGPDDFRAMGIGRRRGRGFARHDTSQSPRVAVIDEAFAASVFPDDDPLGQRIRLDRVDGPVEVVGVVAAVKHWGLDGRVAGHGSRVASYQGTGRTREIGVRVALGAQRRDIAVALLAPMGRVVLVGIVLGLLGAVGATRLIAGMLFGVSPTDPVTLGSVAGLLALVALVASSVPVRRAWRVDPVVALRHE